MFLNKFSDHATHGKIADVKRDLWSVLRDNAYDTIGLDADTRKALEPVVQTAESLLPPGGAIQPAGPGIGSFPQATGFNFTSTLPTPVLIGAGLLVIGLVYLIAKE